MSDQTQNNGSNVIDLQTRQTILPAKLRASIMGQYSESKELGHEASVFAQKLERRLVSDLAYTGAQVIKNFFNEEFGGK